MGYKSPYSFYKHLVKHEVTKMRDILTRVKKYIQIKDITRVSSNRSPKQGMNWRNRRYSWVSPKKTPSWTIEAANKSSSNLIKSLRNEADPTSFKILMDQVYNAFKVQDFIRHPRPLPTNPKVPGVEEYCVFHDGWDTAPWTVVLSSGSFKSW